MLRGNAPVEDSSLPRERDDPLADSPAPAAPAPSPGSAAAVSTIAVVADHLHRALLGASAIAIACFSLAGSPSAVAAGRPRTVLPIVKQVFRNNCETAALSMLLVSRDVRVDQTALQRELPRSGPLDPRIAADGTWLWGNPERGFVGRVEGGGVAGGYGVYTGPIRALAARHGVYLYGLTGRAPGALYARLSRGRPVMAWVGLSPGPYQRWQTPQRKEITGNFGEHTVVLTGVRAGSVLVNDPLSGQRVEWTKASFELMWERLGRRAVGV